MRNSGIVFSYQFFMTPSWETGFYWKLALICQLKSRVFELNPILFWTLFGVEGLEVLSFIQSQTWQMSSFEKNKNCRPFYFHVLL